MSDLAAQLAYFGESRRITGIDAGWKAAKAVVDDFIEKSVTMVVPTPGGGTPVCNLPVADGPDPRFEFDPYAAVRRRVPEVDAGSWECSANWIIPLLEKRSQLTVTWCGSDHKIYLSLPAAVASEAPSRHVRVGRKANVTNIAMPFPTSR